MSSILDALNKLEEEKKEAARTVAEAAIDPRIAARELVGHSGARRPSHGNPLMWGLVGMGLFSLITLGAAAAAYFMVKPALPLANVATAPPAVNATPPPATVQASPGTSVTETSEAASPTGPPEPKDGLPKTAPTATTPASPSPAAQVPAPKPTPPIANSPALPTRIDVASNALPDLAWVEESAKTTNSAAEVAGSEAVVAREAVPAPLVEATPLPPALPGVETPPAAPPEPSIVAPGPLPSDISKLPMLRDSDKGRIGFDKVKINMLQPKSDSRPYAKAIINLKPVLIGERIPDTRTTLIAVQINGIAIEVNGSRERYFVSFGYGI